MNTSTFKFYSFIAQTLLGCCKLLLKCHDICTATARKCIDKMSAELTAKGAIE